MAARFSSKARLDQVSLTGESQEDDKSQSSGIRIPDIHDLAKRLRFAPQQGRIWLDDQRMMLMHVSSLGALRQELIESLGKEMEMRPCFRPFLPQVKLSLRLRLESPTLLTPA